MSKSSLKWRPIATVHKYDCTGRCYETVISKGNILTTSGMERLAELIIGDAISLNGNSVRIGVGDSPETENVADTNLGDNEYYEVMENDFPQADGGLLTFRAEFGDSDANFTWNCWGLDVDDTETATASDSPNDLFNRKVFNFGTKTGGAWTITVQLSLEQ
jgi:hypothetical protein